MPPANPGMLSPPWPPAVLAAIAAQAGFTGRGLELAVAVAMAESGGNPAAKNTNTDTFHSVDRGLWQINDHWHPEVSDGCAYTPTCCAKAALRISSGGSSFGAWATFKNGAAQQNIGAAQDGIQTMRAVGGPAKYLQAMKVEAGANWSSGGPGPGGTGIPGSGLVGDITAPLKWGEELASFLGKLNDSSRWLRGLEIVGGVGLMGLGIVFVAKSLAGDAIAAAVAPPGAAKAVKAARPAKAAAGGASTKAAGEGASATAKGATAAAAETAAV